ncbi:Fur family transcriptional regulator [Thermasporomyces composti]|jgi:Fur family ferric uptake transcriptional regulator|uniref:Fur family nickel uptake regulator n=1 Tax=Thermasporomyces composti TaxID=696763 RepID=A0A3D9V5Z8_THECX|nr:Fur family transcriptional regulator [Thermasporomyces composti]REF36123.1 Fur family nickel uptake regulator [Thermasporomyces composti]
MGEARERRGGDSASRHEELRAELRSRGYRLTPQRQLVLEAVEELQHATPEQILQVVRRKARGVNISTVYRTLELLEDLDLVTHTHLGDRAPTYHSTSTPAHAHAVCRACGRVSEVPPEAVERFAATLLERYGFRLDIRHLAVFGECTECPQARSGEQAVTSKA